jgi:hypothetical protein
VTLPLDRDPTWWIDQAGMRSAASYFAKQFIRRYPEAAAVAVTDPTAVGEHMPDVRVSWVPGKPIRACSLGGHYDSSITPPVLTIGFSGGRRDGFTLLHEVAHHLMFVDEHWSLEVLSSIPADKRSMVAETAASAFAARMLLPDEAIQTAFRSGVTPRSLWSLADTTAASVTACCARSLEVPGDRLVLFTDLNGVPWYAGTTGAPFSPGRVIAQPSIARLVDRANDDGTARLIGGEGIVYRTGRANTDVAIEIAVRGPSAIAVVTPELPSQGLRPDSEVDTLECPSCDSAFSQNASPSQCARCAQWRCPECGSCGCEARDVICQRCFVALPASLVAAGATEHEECY